MTTDLCTAEELQRDPDPKPTPWEAKAIIALLAATWTLAMASVGWMR